MEEPIHDLQTKMEAAAAALDFEEARRLRDQIGLMRGGASAMDAAAADLSGTRQRPGAMGLGSGQPQFEPPDGWSPPAKPDAMTSGRSARRS